MTIFIDFLIGMRRESVGSFLKIVYAAIIFGYRLSRGQNLEPCGQILKTFCYYFAGQLIITVLMYSSSHVILHLKMVIVILLNVNK